ncbi:hypothetical protein [Enterococcus sp. LJL120]
MPLTNRQKKERPTVAQVANTSRINEEKQEEPTIAFNTTKKSDSQKRKTIKVDPDIKSLIEIFSDFDGTREYETLRNMAEFYYKNNYDERAQRIIANIQSNKYIG